MKKVTFEDLYSFNFLSDIAVSPDEQHLVFSQHKADEQKNGYDSFDDVNRNDKNESFPLRF